jgi:hypothetical protein
MLSHQHRVLIYLTCYNVLDGYVKEGGSSRIDTQMKHALGSCFFVDRKTSSDQNIIQDSSCQCIHTQLMPPFSCCLDIVAVHIAFLQFT